MLFFRKKITVFGVLCVYLQRNYYLELLCLLNLQ